MTAQPPIPPEGVFDPSRRALTVGLLLAIAMFAVEGMGVVPALPTAVRELRGLDFFGWTFAAFMLAWLFGSVGGGFVADVLGPRRPMALGLLGFGAGLLLAAGAGGMRQLLLGRVLQGIGGGGMLSAAYVAIARGYPDEMRARIMALVSSVWVLPALVGPAISGAITERFGWRWVFVGAAPFMLVAAAMVLPQLRRFDRSEPWPSTARVWSALRVAIGCALLIASPTLRRWGSLTTGLSFAAGAALLVTGLLRVMPRGTLWAAPGLPAGLVVRGLLGFAFFGAEAFIPLASSSLRGVGATQAGLALSAGALGWVGSSWWQERIEKTRGPGGRHARITVGFIVLAGGLAIVTATLVSTAPMLLVPLGWAIAGAGIGLAFTANGLVCLKAAPPGEEGEVSGQLQIAEALCTAAGAGVGGVVLSTLVHLEYSSRAAHAAVFFVCFATALLGVLVAARLKEVR